GTVRVAEVDLYTAVDGEARVIRHLFALIPGQRTLELCRQGVDVFGERVSDLVSAVSVRQRDQHHEAGRALHQGGHRVHALAHQQIAFPVTGNRAVVRFCGSFANTDSAAELALAVHHAVPARPPAGVSPAQVASEFLA